MERIAPLAKILAEANGIEWEHLPGTGPGGQIVEQDILDYLTRVMSGEAEPPSTPVDAPPPDWDGNDVPGAGMFDAAALSKAGVESDIAEFVSQGRPAGPQVPGTNAPALETSDFELDDSEAPDSLMAPTQPAPTQPAPTQPALVEVAPEPTPVAPAPVAPMTNPVAEPTAPSVTPAAAAATGAATGGLGSLLSRLYHKDDVAPEVSTPEVHTPEVQAPEVHVEPAPVVEVAQVEADAKVHEARVDAGVHQVPAPEPVQVAPHTPHAEQVETAAPATEPVQPAAVVEPTPDVIATPIAAAPIAAAPVAAPVADAPVTPALVPAASSTMYSGPSSEIPRDAVWFGTYMRKNANLGTLEDLRGQLTEALERDVPLALLVARAAQRHMDILGFQNVAMQDINNNKALSVGLGSASGIRDALTAIDSTYDGTPDLLIVNAGEIGLDDLHYPHTLTLSVSRVEDGKASLSLQGDIEPAKAAQFLGKVADTLEKPVILLV